MPPLVHHLVGRPPKTQMQVNYARLCAPYVAACAFLRGAVAFGDFNDATYADPIVQDLARRIAIEIRDSGDPNALAPIEVEVLLRSGKRHTARVEVVYGNPAKPMTREAHLAKFVSNAKAAARPVHRERAEALIELIDGLEDINDMTMVVDHLIG